MHVASQMRAAALAASLLAGTLMISNPVPAAEEVPPEPIVVAIQPSEEEERLEAQIQYQTLRMQEVQRLVQQREVRREARLSLLAASRGEGRSLLDYPLSRESGLTSEELDQVLSDTPFAGMGSAFYGAEQQYNVNALALIGIAALESGWGQSEYAQVRNNLFGFAAYTHDPDQAVYFDSWDESIEAAARTLAEDYLDPEGRYYRGGTLAAIGPIWAADPDWAWKVADVIGYLLRRTEEAQ